MDKINDSLYKYYIKEHDLTVITTKSDFEKLTKMFWPWEAGDYEEEYVCESWQMEGE